MPVQDLAWTDVAGPLLMIDQPSPRATLSKKKKKKKKKKRASPVRNMVIPEETKEESAVPDDNLINLIE